MHIKNTVGCHHIPSRMTEIKNSDNGVGEDAEKPSHSCIAGGNVKCYGHFRTQKGNFFKKRKKEGREGEKGRGGERREERGGKGERRRERNIHNILGSCNKPDDLQ